MLALSVRPPWWFCILSMGMDMDNRDWYTPFRGRVLLHVSKWWNDDQVQDDLGDALYILERSQPDLEVKPQIDLMSMQIAGGFIIGSVEIIDCIQSSKSPWFQGKYGLQLANPITFSKPIPCIGARGLFEVPEAVAFEAEAQYLHRP